MCSTHALCSKSSAEAKIRKEEQTVQLWNQLILQGLCTPSPVQSKGQPVIDITQPLFLLIQLGHMPRPAVVCKTCSATRNHSFNTCVKHIHWITSQLIQLSRSSLLNIVEKSLLVKLKTTGAIGAQVLLICLTPLEV